MGRGAVVSFSEFECASFSRITITFVFVLKAPCVFVLVSGHILQVDNRHLALVLISQIHSLIVVVNIFYWIHF